MFNTDTRLVIGLGNPGKNYEKTYHNVGFLFLDSLAKGGNDDTDRSKKWKKAKSFRYTRVGNLLLAKPTRLMNNSGGAVKEILAFFELNPSNILVAHDDSDIQLGNYKIALSGSSAGHKGIESVIKALETDKFARLRIGIRHRSGKAEEFVLNKIRKDDLQKLQQLFSEIEASHFKLHTE